MANDILDLSDLKVVNTEQTHNSYIITAEPTYSPKCCQKCGTVRENGRSKFGTKEQTFADSPIRGKKVIIKVIRQRYRCHDCGSTFWEGLPNIVDNHKATRRLIHYVQREVFKKTFTMVGNEVGLTEGTIRNIFHEYVKHLDLNQPRFMPKWVGIDEIHLIGKPRCIITNIHDRTVIDMLPDRNKPTVYEWLYHCRQLRNIEYVTMDMWKPYRDVFKSIVPDAKVIVDKFHIVRMANQSLETVRKTYRKHLDSKQRKALLNDRFMLLTRRHRLNDKQQDTINSWMDKFPLLYNAYVAKEFFYEIWDSKDKQEAMERYKQWLSLISSDLQLAYQPLITAMANWNEEIMNYFEMPLTNAYTESLNNLIRNADRLGRGYSFEVTRAKIMYTQQKKELPMFDEYGRIVPLETLPVYTNDKFTGVPIDIVLKMIDKGELD